MPAFSNVALQDRASTPVVHTFNPVGIDTNGVAKWKEPLGVPVGEKTLTLSNKLSNGKYRIKLVLSYPISQTQTINGVSTTVVVRTSYAEVNFTFDGQSSTQERADTVEMTARSLLASSTQVNAVAVDLGQIY